MELFVSCGSDDIWWRLKHVNRMFVLEMCNNLSWNTVILHVFFQPVAMKGYCLKQYCIELVS